MPFNGFLGPSWEMYALTRIQRHNTYLKYHKGRGFSSENE